MTERAIARLTELIKREGDPDIAGRLATGAASAQLIAFGEIHGQPNQLQKLGRELMSDLKKLDFSKMAIEVPDLESRKPLFAAFNSRVGDDLNLATAMAIYQDHKAFAAKLHGSPLEWDFFQLLLAARDQDIEVIPVDLEDSQVDDTIRDKHLAERVSELLDAGDRVIYWGGALHLHKRPKADIKRKFKSMVEILWRFRKKYKAYSVAGVIDCKEYPGLEPIWKSLKEPTYLNTKSLEQDPDMFIRQRICGPHGADPNHPGSETIPLFYWYWDALIFLLTPPVV